MLEPSWAYENLIVPLCLPYALSITVSPKLLEGRTQSVGAPGRNAHMVALAFSIAGFLACVFLIYVLAQFHRELARAKASRRPYGRSAIVTMPSRRLSYAMGARTQKAS